MADYKKLSERTFNIQAKTYYADKNGKYARTLCQHTLDILSAFQFSNILDVWCGTEGILSAIRKLYPTVSLQGDNFPRNVETIRK